MSAIQRGHCAKCFVCAAVFLYAELQFCLTSERSFGMVVFAKSTTMPKGEVIMSRKREAVFMGLGILAGLALSGPAVQAADYLTAPPVAGHMAAVSPAPAGPRSVRTPPLGTSHGGG